MSLSIYAVVHWKTTRNYETGCNLHRPYGMSIVIYNLSVQETNTILVLLFIYLIYLSIYVSIYIYISIYLTNNLSVFMFLPHRSIAPLLPPWGPNLALRLFSCPPSPSFDAPSPAGGGGGLTIGRPGLGWAQNQTTSPIGRGRLRPTTTNNIHINSCMEQLKKMLLLLVVVVVGTWGGFPRPWTGYKARFV